MEVKLGRCSERQCCLSSGLSVSMSSVVFVVFLSFALLHASDGFLVGAPTSLQLRSHFGSCSRLYPTRCARPQLRRMLMSSPNEEEEESKVEKASTDVAAEDEAMMKLDLSERKIKAAELRQDAKELEDTSAALRKDAVQKEQQAAKLRIRAWQLEGSVSAVSKEINIGNKYERQLAELDLMAEDWIDTDEEKWDWYQKQREMITEMIESQKYYDKQADEQIQDLKEVLSEVATLLNVETLDSKGDITSVGYIFVVLSVVIPIFIGYELFQFLSQSSLAFFGAISGNDDPFNSL